MQIYDISIAGDRREETAHGTYDFPMAVYDTQLDKNVLGFVNWHWHEEIQFVYVTQGSVEYFVDNDSVILNEGDGIFINSEVLHKSCPIDRPDSCTISIVMHERMLSGFLGSRIGQKYVLPYLQNDNLAFRILHHKNEDERQVIEQLKEINNLFTNHGSGWELELQIKLLHCWKSFLQLDLVEVRESAALKDTDRLKSMMNLISERFGDKLTLADFAGALHLSSGECCRLFKRQMHCTLFEYIADYRIEKSLYQLKYTDDPISMIAYDCGFASTSYYIKKFREKTGKTPLEYRKMQ